MCVGKKWFCCHHTFPDLIVYDSSSLFGGLGCKDRNLYEKCMINIIFVYFSKQNTSKYVRRYPTSVYYDIYLGWFYISFEAGCLYRFWWTSLVLLFLSDDRRRSSKWNSLTNFPPIFKPMLLRTTNSKSTRHDFTLLLLLASVLCLDTKYAVTYSPLRGH